MPEPTINPITSSAPATSLSKEDYAARAGVDVGRITDNPTGGFMVAPQFIKTEQGSGVVSDTSGIQSDINNLGNDITKGLAQYGITSPNANVDNTISNQVQTELTNRQNELKSRSATDISNLETVNKASEEQLQLSNEEALAKAEGRTRIGGFMTSMETGDIARLQRQQALDLATLKAQHQSTLEAAKRAYDDQDYQLAQDKLKEAQNFQDNIYKKQQDYFNNVIQYNSLNTPLHAADKAVQTWALDSMTKYPSGFSDLSPAQLVALTPKQIQDRILNSTEYTAELKGQNAPADYKEYNYLVQNGLIPKNTSFLDYQKLKATQFGTEGAGSNTENQKIVNQFNQDATDYKALQEAGSRDQYIRILQARYPQIDPADISRKVHETFPSTLIQ